MKWYHYTPLALAALAFSACNRDRPTEPGGIPSGLRPLLDNAPVNGAAFTTTNTAIDGTGHCKNGSEDVNCNIYDGKQYVWLNGGPSVAYVGDGTYFFAVLQPGGQGGGHNPNDCTPKNLSDFTPCATTNTGAGDAYTNRTFSVSSGTVTYAGTHTFSNNKIRLMPYDDTPNNGGVYILAICSLAEGYPVDPSDCKYDAFKVQVGGGTPAAAVPTVEKTAAGSYIKTYAWAIIKNANPTSVEATGPSVNITYNVTVSRNAAGDQIGNVRVTGTITVGNNNPANVTGVSITDALSDATSCTVTGASSPVTIGPGDNTFNYSCSLSALPTAALNNTVTISWGAQSVGGLALAAGTASFTVFAIVFTEDIANAVNATINVTDAFNLNPAVPIGTLLSPPGTSTVTLATAPRTFTYIRSITVTPAQCVQYPNTATITQTGQTANANVTVCGPLLTGGHTLGFWSNRNGQSLIKTYCQGTTLRDYLRGFSPYQDLSASANCNGVATYVGNVIAAATCSSDSNTCNTMLKAQMLATALSVFFTGPGWTSTQISNVKPPSVFMPNSSLGGVTIDLTQICATISGCPPFQNVSAAFNNQTSMTVSQMLTWAASQSNAGGSSWYGQVKATQVLAKNAFDAINNNVVFAP